MSNPVPGTSSSGGITAAQMDAAIHRATMAADLAEEDGPGLDAALGALCEGLDDAFVAALVLEHERLWLAGTSRYTMIPDGIALDEGVVGRAAHSGEVQLVDDVEADPDFIRATPGIVCQLAIPLHVGARTVGVLSIESATPLPRPPDTALASLAQSLARRLDGLRTSRAVDLSMLARLFVYISSLREPSSIGDVTCRALARILPLDTSQVAIVDDAGRLGESAVWRASLGRARSPRRAGVGSAARNGRRNRRVRGPRRVDGRRGRCGRAERRRRPSACERQRHRARRGHEQVRAAVRAQPGRGGSAARRPGRGVARRRRLAPPGAHDRLDGLSHRTAQPAGLRHQARARARDRAGGASHAQRPDPRLRRLQGGQRPRRARVRRRAAQGDGRCAHGARSEASRVSRGSAATSS